MELSTQAPDAADDTITISVGPELARTFRAASPEMQKKWALIARFQLEGIVHNPPGTWEEIAGELGRQAAANGLTQEELDDILREWDEERKAKRRAAGG